MVTGIRWAERGDWLNERHEEITGVIEMFRILTEVMVTQLYTFSKTHWKLWNVYSLVCKLYLNKKYTVKKKGTWSIYSNLLLNLLGEGSSPHIGLTAF